MWPRIFSQLIEFLPHATRLMPIADNYLAVRREGEQAKANAIADLAENLRTDIGRVSDSYNGLARQISEQKTQIAVMQDALEVAQTQSITQTKQLEWITTDLDAVRKWVKFGTAIIVVLLIVVVGLTLEILHSH